jgi:hypothetical protein
MSAKETFVKTAIGAVERVLGDTHGAASETSLAKEVGTLLSSPAARVAAPTTELESLRSTLGYKFVEADKTKMAYPKMSEFNPDVSFGSAIKAAIAEAKVTEAKDRLPVKLTWARNGEPAESVMVHGDSSVMGVRWDFGRTRNESIMRNRWSGNKEDSRSLSVLGRAKYTFSDVLLASIFRGY